MEHTCSRSRRCPVAIAALPGIAPILLVLTAAPRVLGQTAIVFDPPDPAGFFQNTSLTIVGTVGFVPSLNDDTIWSFDVLTGNALDQDGLAFDGQSSHSALFSNSRLALGGAFSQTWGVLVVDISDPTNLVRVGFIPIRHGIGGQPIAVARDGVTGFIAAWGNDTLYSFSTRTLALVDPDGLRLPGNPDRMTLTGDRLPLVDTQNGDIMVVDVSNPANMTLAGVIDLPPSRFNSANDIVLRRTPGPGLSPPGTASSIRSMFWICRASTRTGSPSERPRSGSTSRSMARRWPASTRKD